MSSREGATGSGASRAGGEHEGDAFTRREKAAEDAYIRQREQEKLREWQSKKAEKERAAQEDGKKGQGAGGVV